LRPEAWSGLRSHVLKDRWRGKGKGDGREIFLDFSRFYYVLLQYLAEAELETADTEGS
jgi:hypothetical protein